MTLSMKPETDKLLTLAQVGEFLQQSADTVIRAIKRGQLRAYLLNSGRRKKTYRVSMEQLEAFLANREVNGSGKRKMVLRPPTLNPAIPGAQNLNSFLNVSERAEKPNEID